MKKTIQATIKTEAYDENSNNNEVVLRADIFEAENIAYDEIRQCIISCASEIEKIITHKKIKHSDGQPYSKSEITLYASSPETVDENDILECESNVCVFNSDGQCRYAAVTGKAPFITATDGCLDGIVKEPDDNIFRSLN